MRQDWEPGSSELLDILVAPGPSSCGLQNVQRERDGPLGKQVEQGSEGIDLNELVEVRRKPATEAQ